jgi:carbamate kinase
MTCPIPREPAGSPFAEGSMAPKVRAACWFAAIGSIHDTQALLRGEAGTRVALDAVRTG